MPGPATLEVKTHLNAPHDPNYSPAVPSPLVRRQAPSHGANGKPQSARERFEDVWPGIRESLIADFTAAGMPDAATDWFRRNLDYNTPGGKLNRGLSVVDTVEILKGRSLTDDEYTKAAVLGWCVELLQAFFLVADDIMDQSVTRRGQPCWFRQDGIGNIAINDSFLLESAIYRLLKIHFRSEPYYVDLLDLFHEISYQTEMGQLVDLITAPEDEVDLNKFSLERHRLIVVYKTAYYSFYLPVALAMHMCGIPSTTPFASTFLPNVSAAPPPASLTSPTSSSTTTSPTDPYFLALQILLPLGEYFQVQDDFLDFSAPPEQLGKIGTDIIDNKCSWCVNTALALATPAQRAVLDENYGRKDAEKEGRVKALYEELDIRGRYREYEERAYGRIVGLIETIPASGAPTPGGSAQSANGSGEAPPALKREVFKTFLDKIYKRSK